MNNSHGILTEVDNKMRETFTELTALFTVLLCVWSLCLGAHTYPIQPVVFSQGRLERGHWAISAQSPTIIKHRVLFHRSNPPHQAPLLGRKSPFCLTLSTLMRRVLCLSNRSNQFMSKRIAVQLCSFDRVALHVGRRVPNAENLKQFYDIKVILFFFFF